MYAHWLRDQKLGVGVAGLLFAAFAWGQPSQGTIVRLVTNVGPIDMRLMDQDAPRTTANFLSYVRSGAYNGSFFHRLVRGFVLQGGGLSWNSAQQTPLSAVPADASIANEFSAARSNLRATVAMAKVDGNPDSATSQWFINLADNSANLDQQNGGFTVFAQVLTPSMGTVDAIAAFPLINASGCTNLGTAATVMGQVPMPVKPANCEAVGAANLVQILSAKELAPRYTIADNERVFDFLEAYIPQYFSPASASTIAVNGFVYRYYSSTQTYVAAKDGTLYAMGPASNGQILALGSVNSWLTQATAKGY